MFGLITGRVGHAQLAARVHGMDLTVPAAKDEAACAVAAKVTGAKMMATDSPQVTMNLRSDSVGELHIIVEATDTGQPPLTAYRRAVVTVD